MGNYFNEVVDRAIEDLYYCCDNDKAKAAADALLLAAKEDDGDACYFLSRCFSGSCYSWEYHPFEENEAAAYAMLREAGVQVSILRLEHDGEGDGPKASAEPEFMAAITCIPGEKL